MKERDKKLKAAIFKARLMKRPRLGIARAISRKLHGRDPLTGEKLASIDDLEAPPSMSLVPHLKRVHNLGKASSWTEIGPDTSPNKRWKPPRMPWVRDKIASVAEQFEKVGAAGKATKAEQYGAIGHLGGAALGGAVGYGGERLISRHLLHPLGMRFSWIPGPLTLGGLYLGGQLGERVGRRVAKREREKKAEIRALIGDMGVGKTTLAKKLSPKFDMVVHTDTGHPLPGGGYHRPSKEERAGIRAERSKKILSAHAAGKRVLLEGGGIPKYPGVLPEVSQVVKLDLPRKIRRQRVKQRAAERGTDFREDWKFGQAFKKSMQEQEGAFGMPIQRARSPEAAARLLEKRAYKLQGHTNVQGLPISIENRKGSVRKGKDSDGNEWRTEMKHPYGYITGTKGADGEPVDAYVGPDKEAPNAFVVHQRDKETGKYDEDKVMLGFSSKAAAKAAFLLHYDSPKFLGPISRVSVDRLRELVKSKKRLVKIHE